MPPSPQVKCHPYFKLRRLTPHIQIGPLAPSPWNVPNLCSAYKWPSSLSGGGVIAIVELGGGWVQSDIDQYFKTINQPVPQITDVSVDGTSNSPNQSTGSNSDPDYEVALDIELAGAAYYAATGKAATIRVYWSQDIASAVLKAANDGCDVCSISWGADEENWGTTAAQEMESAAA
jgi:kumamolisin